MSSTVFQTKGITPVFSALVPSPTLSRGFLCFRFLGFRFAELVGRNEEAVSGSLLGWCGFGSLHGFLLDKVSLSGDQVLRVYFYELGGQRELVLTIDAKDINRAKSAL